MRGREEIIGAALRQLNEDPTVSMGQLAEAIGISRATLHRHFASRDALVRALGQRACDHWERSQLAAGIAAAAESGDAERLGTALRVLLRGLVDDAEEYGFALTDHFMARMPDLIARSDELEDREVAFYAAAQRAGVLRADLPARWVSNAIYGLLIAARDSLRHGDVARRDVEHLVLTTFLRGAGGTP